jgi:Arc/MetJ-type ribon-helix-helix transcriptional regulator
MSRSELIRKAVRAYLADTAEEITCRQIVEGYRRLPETDVEADRAAAAARRLLGNPDLPW